MWNGMFERIKRVPRDSTVALAAILSFIPFVFLTLFFVYNERALMASSDYGVLQFEVAWTAKTIDKIFAAWGPANVQHQIYVHHVDYLYLIVYGLFALLCVLLLARKLEGKLQQAGFFFVLAPRTCRDLRRHGERFPPLDAGARSAGWGVRSSPRIPVRDVQDRLPRSLDRLRLYCRSAGAGKKVWGERGLFLPYDHGGGSSHGGTPCGLGTLPVLRDRSRILRDRCSVHMDLEVGEHGCIRSAIAPLSAPECFSVLCRKRGRRSAHR